MSYVIAEPCIGTKDNSCVEVCPVDCIHPTPDEPGYAEAEMLFIDPDECIDCDACVEACPAGAIFNEDDLPDEKKHFLELNEELSQIWPQISDQKDPLPDAEKWDGVDGKLEHLIKTAPDS